MPEGVNNDSSRQGSFFLNMSILDLVSEFACDNMDDPACKLNKALEMSPWTRWTGENTQGQASKSSVWAKPSGPGMYCPGHTLAPGRDVCAPTGHVKLRIKEGLSVPSWLFSALLQVFWWCAQCRSHYSRGCLPRLIQRQFYFQILAPPPECITLHFNYMLTCLPPSLHPHPLNFQCLSLLLICPSSY